jgi:replicative superfamily II helicase
MRILSEAYNAKLKEREQDQEEEGGVGKGKKTGKNVRIIALSATLPNLQDIGDWLRCDPQVRYT